MSYEYINRGQGGLAKTLVDETTGKVINCYCVARDTSYNETSGECETLPETCNKNADCNRGEYCNITDYGSMYCTKDTSGMSGECRDATNDIKTLNSGTNPPFIVSSRAMCWWSAVNFCEALGKALVEVSDYGCAHSINSAEGYCHADTSIDVTSSSTSNVSANVVAMKAAYGNYNCWTNTDYNSCYAYLVLFNGGYVKAHIRNHGGYHAACK